MNEWTNELNFYADNISVCLRQIKGHKKQLSCSHFTKNINKQSTVGTAAQRVASGSGLVALCYTGPHRRSTQIHICTQRHDLSLDLLLQQASFSSALKKQPAVDQKLRMGSLCLFLVHLYNKCISCLELLKKELQCRSGTCQGDKCQTFKA